MLLVWQACLSSPTAFWARWHGMRFMALEPHFSRLGLSFILRQLGKGDAPASVATWYNVAGFGVLSVIMIILLGPMESISQSVLIDLVILKVIGSAFQIVMTTGYRRSDAVLVASMRYVQMPISGVVGYFVFAEMMSASEIIGALVIIASSLVIA